MVPIILCYTAFSYRTMFGRLDSEIMSDATAIHCIKEFLVAGIFVWILGLFLASAFAVLNVISLRKVSQKLEFWLTFDS